MNVHVRTVLQKCSESVQCTGICLISYVETESA